MGFCLWPTATGATLANNEVVLVNNRRGFVPAPIRSGLGCLGAATITNARICEDWMVCA
jgi:hypothetical protein